MIAFCRWVGSSRTWSMLWGRIHVVSSSHWRKDLRTRWAPHLLCSGTFAGNLWAYRWTPGTLSLKAALIMGICNVDSKYTDLQPFLFAFLRLHHVRCTFIKLSFCWSCSTLTYCHLHQPSCSLFNQTLSLSPSPPPFLTINTVLMGFTAIHKCVGGLPFTHIKF